MNDPILPEEGFLKLRHIIGDMKANPPLYPIIPVCKLTWFKGIREGRYPHPVRLGPTTTAWDVKDIHLLVERLKKQAESYPFKDSDMGRAVNGRKEEKERASRLMSPKL